MSDIQDLSTYTPRERIEQIDEIDEGEESQNSFSDENDEIRLYRNGTSIQQHFYKRQVRKQDCTEYTAKSQAMKQYLQPSHFQHIT